MVVKFEAVEFYPDLHLEQRTATFTKVVFSS